MIVTELLLYTWVCSYWYMTLLENDNITDIEMVYDISANLTFCNEINDILYYQFEEGKIIEDMNLQHSIINDNMIILNSAEMLLLYEIYENLNNTDQLDDIEDISYTNLAFNIFMMTGICLLICLMSGLFIYHLTNKVYTVENKKIELLEENEEIKNIPDVKFNYHKKLGFWLPILFIIGDIIMIIFPLILIYSSGILFIFIPIVGKYITTIICNIFGIIWITFTYVLNLYSFGYFITKNNIKDKKEILYRAIYSLLPGMKFAYMVYP